MNSTALPFPVKPRRWASALLKLCGWRHEFLPPPEKHVLCVVYPHTSNWDFLWGILSRWSSGWPINWIAKHSLFVWPVAKLLKSWGGIPINRSAAGGFVEALTHTIKSSDYTILAITPEGTRSYRDHWKDGFYRIALSADLPIGIGYVDYATKTVGVSEYFRLSGNEADDMARIAKAYASRVAHSPEKAAPIVLNAKRANSKKPS